MPRHASDNTESITIKMPEAWLKRAQKLADESNKRAMIGKLTRTDVLRAALSLGLGELEKLEKQVMPLATAMGREPAQPSKRSKRHPDCEVARSPWGAKK